MHFGAYLGCVLAWRLARHGALPPWGLGLVRASTAAAEVTLAEAVAVPSRRLSSNTPIALMIFKNGRSSMSRIG